MLICMLIPVLFSFLLGQNTSDPLSSKFIDSARYVLRGYMFRDVYGLGCILSVALVPSPSSSLFIINFISSD